MTPQLQQAIRLLQLSRMELAELVHDEMIENPILDDEMDLENERSPRPRRHGLRRAGGSPARSAGQLDRDPDRGLGRRRRRADRDQGRRVRRSTRSTGRTTSTTTRWRPPMPAFRGDGDEMPSLEATLTKPPSLHDHLAWQLKMTEPAARAARDRHDDPRQHRRRRLLQGSAAGRARRRTSAPIEVVCEQRAREDPDFDPIGVGARSLAECMLIQASPQVRTTTCASR